MLQYLSRLRRKRGFTLIEVMIVLVVLAILASIAVPSLTAYIDKANEKRDKVNAMNVMTAAQAAFKRLYLEGASLEVSDPKYEKEFWDKNNPTEKINILTGGHIAALDDQWWESAQVADNGDTTLVYTDFAKNILAECGLDGDNMPYRLIIGTGYSEEYLKNEDTTDDVKAYTVYFCVYWATQESRPLIYDGSDWVYEYPWPAWDWRYGADNKFNTESEKNITLQFYFLTSWVDWGDLKDRTGFKD